ncbi:MAG TPA: 6-bladed beta-propeller, partial [Nitrospirota bacterium]|nr:6-bladed beta-propeller [Nitrospirota bacterium]
QSIHAEDDIGRESTFFEWLFGKQYDDTISRPYGVFARNSKLVVTDLRKRGVLIFDLAAKRMNFMGGEGNLQTPASAVMDAAGNVYVADAGKDRILIYDPNGDYRTAFVIKDSKPVALAINDRTGRLYVVDRKSHRVVVLSLEGKELFSFGRQGKEDGEFNIPLGVALDGNNRIYVLDSGNFRVQQFDENGKFLLKFGSAGDRHGFFSNPKGIALDSDGHLYVTDAAFNNFQIFNQQGDVLLSVGRMGSAPGYLYLPGGIAIDENDRIYVADQFNARIQVFQYLKAP